MKGVYLYNIFSKFKNLELNVGKEAKEFQFMGVKNEFK